MIPKETVDRIIETARVEEVVGEFVALKKRGSNMIGLCPFHNEKSPSFNVSPARGIYKCFGCGKGGNPVNFIMDHESLSYPEALRWLAKKYNIEIEEEERSVDQLVKDNERESLFIVSTFAQKHYSKNLHETEEGKAIGLTYFRERGFRPEIIEKFQLGFSPDTWRDLTDAAIAAGYKLEYLVKAGLTIQNEENADKFFDRFKGRVIFPVHNTSGRVIAFGGRTLRTDKKIAKYINSPETDIYHKSNVLYGLYFAKKQIIQDDVCFLVEGYTDVISMHQAGIENVVASSGTSLTVEQIRLIRRYTNNITILYDGDPAGIKASFRGINLILEEGMDVRVLLFPDNEDPDSYSKRVSSEELKAFIAANTKDFIAFKTQLLIDDVQNDPIKKAGLIYEIVESIALIPDSIKRSLFIRECARIMDIDEQSLLTELNKIRRKSFDKKRTDEIQQEENNQQQPFIPDADLDEQPPEQAAILDRRNTKSLEREIIRLLLLFGNHSVVMEGENEQGEKEEHLVPVAEVLLHEIEEDNITFTFELFVKILDEVKEQAKRNVLPDINYFLHQQDDDMRQIAVDLMSSPYSSHTWEKDLFLSRNEKRIKLSAVPHTMNDWERHFIYPLKEDAQLRRSVIDSVRKLKLRHLELLIAEKQQLLKVSEDLKDEQAMLTIMAEIKNLGDAKVFFAKELGQIILR